MRHARPSASLAPTRTMPAPRASALLASLFVAVALPAHAAGCGGDQFSAGGTAASDDAGPADATGDDGADDTSDDSAPIYLYRHDPPDADAGADDANADGCAAPSCGIACDAGYTVCGATCTDVHTDAKNCGTCGHDCQGGACSGGMCQPVVLGEDPGGVNLVVYGKYLYLTGNADGNVYGCPTDGCPNGPFVVASAQPNYLAGLVANSAGVYWTTADVSGGIVTGCAVGNCTDIKAPLAAYGPGQEPYVLASDSTALYWTVMDSTGGSGGSVSKCALSGCGRTPDILAAGGSPGFIAEQSGFLYWLVRTTSDAGESTTELVKCSSDGCGGSPTLLVSAVSAKWDRIAIDAANVYWLDMANGGILRCGVGGSATPTRLASSQNPTWVAVDDTSVYWTDASGVVRCTKPSCTDVTVLASGHAPGPVAVDTASIYWFGADTSGSKIMKLAK